MATRARYNVVTMLFRLYVLFRDDCATFASITRSKREIRQKCALIRALGLGLWALGFGLRNLRTSLKRKKKIAFFEIDLSNRFEPCFPLQNYRFSPQIDYNRWSVRERTIDRYNCRIRNITIPVIDLSSFF